MAGKKGQKWNTEREPAKMQSSVSLKPEVYSRVKRLAAEKRWSMSATIEWICEEHFKDE